MFEPIDRVMNMRKGGSAVAPRRTVIGGQDHMLSYITPQEGEILMRLGGSGRPGPMGIPAYDDLDEGYGAEDMGGAAGGSPGTGGGSASDDVGGGFGGGSSEDSDGFDPLAGTQTQDASTGAPASFGPGTAGYKDTPDFGGYEDLGFNVDQPGTGTGVMTAQNSFNTARGITDKNPYGYQGFFSRVLGIHPSKVDYSGIMGVDTRQAIANNQFSKFVNPTNTPGKFGYNPAFPTAKPGFLRSGVQKAGYNTALGPVQEYAVKRSPSDMLAIAGIGALNPAFGILAEALTDTTYGLKGLAPPDAAPPGEPQTFTGQAFAAVSEGLKAVYDAARETLGDLADRLTPEQAKIVAGASDEEKHRYNKILELVHLP